MAEYSELETVYRSLHAFRSRRRRWEEGPGDESSPPPVLPERPLFTLKRQRRRSPSPPGPLASYSTFPQSENPPGPPVDVMNQVMAAIAAETEFVTCDEALAQVLARPSKVKDLLKKDPTGLKAYQLANPDLALEFELVESASFLHKNDRRACFELVKQTSSDDYKSSSMGWKPKQKKEEMRNEDMIYLLVRKAGGSEKAEEGEEGEKSKKSEKSKEILGFLSFMFTKDDPPREDYDVAYIYEVHVADGLRGRGLGSKLIEFAEAAAMECLVFKTMLTVFTVNMGARKLYRKLGYFKDACSPANKVVRNRVIKPDYLIMGKELGGPW